MTACDGLLTMPTWTGSRRARRNRERERVSIERDRACERAWPTRASKMRMMSPRVTTRVTVGADGAQFPGDAPDQADRAERVRDRAHGQRARRGHGRDAPGGLHGGAVREPRASSASSSSSSSSSRVESSRVEPLAVAAASHRPLRSLAASRRERFLCESSSRRRVLVRSPRQEQSAAPP